MVSVFEILDLALMFFSRSAGLERAQIASLAGAGILVAGINSILPVLQFSNHDSAAVYSIRPRHGEEKSRQPSPQNPEGQSIKEQQ